MRRTPLRQRSAKRAARESAAREARQRVLADAHGRCQIVDVIADFILRWARIPLPVEYDLTATRQLHRCRRWADGVHELRKRSAQGSLADPANLMAACNSCNGWVEDNPELAHHLRLVVRPGDPDWRRLAR